MMNAENLTRYKTAFSPLHNTFVKILKVRYDNTGELLIDALMDGCEMVFRVYELEDYCL